MVDASALLAQTRPDMIGWNGTAAAWLGLANDRALVAAITARTGCPAVTSTLSIFDALAALGTTRVGVVTPYVAAMQDTILGTLEHEGLHCVAERHFELTDNFSFGEVPEARVAQACREVAAEGAEAILVLCTNLAGAGIAAAVEHETGRPVLDSVMLTVWGALRALGQGTEGLAPWGPTVAALPRPVIS
jgi:maleate isomerase